MIWRRGLSDTVPVEREFDSRYVPAFFDFNLIISWLWTTDGVPGIRVAGGSPTAPAES